jgi:serine/threonine protein kinase
MTRPGLPAPSPDEAPNYRLLGRIASGGMGAVYLGVHTDDPACARLVAIKIIHQHLAENRVFVDMLHDEAQVASNIDHPNVVGIIDVGAFRGRNFVVMPYIEGGTLSEFVRRQPRHLPMGLVIRVLSEALHGLHAAHSLLDASGQPLGLVHRDVSPGNILIGIDGITRVIDFGVAKAATRITHTAPGTVKGKFAYMAPEQAMGEPVDCRADVFSAGVVLWTVLTGKRLFNGKNSAHTIRNLISAEIVPPSRLRPKVPAVLDQVCMRALHRVREKRYQSAAAMAADLERAAATAGLETSQDEVGRLVSRAFAERIAQRRAIIDETRHTPRPVTVDEPSFVLEVVDLDDRAPVDSLTPPTPSARGPHARVLRQSDDLPSISISFGEKQSETHSSAGELTSGVRHPGTELTPAEAGSVSASVSQVPLDRAAVMARKPWLRHARYFVLAVLVALAGGAVVMRDRVLALYTELTSAGAGVAAAPVPATTAPVRISIGDDVAAAVPAAPADLPASSDTRADAGAHADAGARADTDAHGADTDAQGDADEPAADADVLAPEDAGESRKSRQRRERRNGARKPPLDIEKNPYLD